MHGPLIAFLSVMMIVQVGWSNGGKKDHCNNLIQMGLMNNMINTGKLSEQFPNMKQDSLDFIKADFDRVKAAADKAISSGKAPPEKLFDQLIERTKITEPKKGQHFQMEGHSDLIESRIKARRALGLDEEKTAMSLTDMGYDIRFNDGKNINRQRQIQSGLNPKRNPDLEINGQIFDIYTPHANSHSAVDGIIGKVQSGQTHRVVIGTSSSMQSDRQIRNLKKELHDRNPDGLHEVLVLRQKNGVPEMVRVFP